LEAQLADESEIIRRIELADKFQNWMETPEVHDYFETVRGQLIEGMLATKQADDLGRYRLQVAVGVLDRFQTYLASSMADGKLARKELEDIRSGRRPFF
jgi:hypothetical protein